MTTNVVDSQYDALNNDKNDMNSISYIENYKDTIGASHIQIFTKYVDVVSKYIVYCRNTTNLNLRKNLEYYKYIFIKGINTICHVLKILLLYTKNTSLVFHHCEKSFFYYIEFIRQIDEDCHTLLKLNSTDASFFVFKKTIYEINEEYRKKCANPEPEKEHDTLEDEDNQKCGDEYVSSSDSMKISRINKMIDIYNRIIIITVNSTILNDSNFINSVSANEDLVLLENKLIKLSEMFLHYLQGEENEDGFFELLNVIEIFILNYKNDNICIVPYITILMKKIKKRIKHPLVNKDKKKMNSSEILAHISKNIQNTLFMKNFDESTRSNPEKYINLLIK